VSTILLSSNLKSGKMTFNMQSLNFLEEVVRPAFEDLKDDAERKGLRITLKEDVPSTCSIIGDKDMLAQHVVRNLIDNAIKYTPKGDVIVGIRCVNSKLVLSVTDSGVGITPADMEHLFTEGGRGHDSVKINVNSTGYGLFFAKQLVVAHGGTIRAESPGHGKGSTFIVELPLATSKYGN
jgi:signal transduction histidine kinase